MKKGTYTHTRWHWSDFVGQWIILQKIIRHTRKPPKWNLVLLKQIFFYVLMLVQFLYGWSVLKSQVQSEMCLRDSCTLVISQSSKSQQGADWSLQLFSSRRQEASFSPFSGELLSRGRWQLWDRGHGALPAAVCCSLCVPACSCHAGCCPQGLTAASALLLCLYIKA